MNILSWFVAAALYSLYYPAQAAEPAHGVNVSTLVSMVNYSANVTGANSAGAPQSLHATERTHSLHATASAAGVDAGVKMHASKFGDLPLFTIVATLAVAWLVAVAGLSLTIKRDYLRTFVSMQTGCAYAQSYFLDNEGDDAKRIEIFFHNARQWQAIRNRVREWVLGMYAVWKALMPSWFTTDLHARIPDEFMPAQVVHGLNAQAPGGRRPTLQNMGLLRRVSQLAAAVTADESSSSDGDLHIPAATAATHVEPTSVQSAEGLHGGNAVHLDEAVEKVQSSLKPGGGSASLKLGNRARCLAPRDMASMMDTYNLMYMPKIWTATDESNLRLMESAEVSELAPSCCPAIGDAEVQVPPSAAI